MVKTAPFPARVVIGWKYWYAAGVDGFNNTIDGWTDPVDRKVISWQSARVLSRDGVHEVEDTDHVMMAVPPDFTWDKKDLVSIPGRGDFLIVGIENAGEGFHGWKPGITLKLELGQG